jgi:hypothetical protein
LLLVLASSIDRSRPSGSSGSRGPQSFGQLGGIDRGLASRSRALALQDDAAERGRDVRRERHDVAHFVFDDVG